MTWLGIKAKLIAAGAVLLAVLAAILRMRGLRNSRDRFKRDAETYKAQVNQQKKIAAADAEIDNEFSDLKRESEKDLDNDKMPGNIRDRNRF